LRDEQRQSKITAVDTDTSPPVLTTDPAERTSAASLWPAIGGGFLALGLALGVLPSLFRNATGLTSPLFSTAQTVGIAFLVMSFVVFGTVAMQSIAHASRRASIR
jgi:ABC-type nitrate/sulfonate/bicarbonate transport system permease component